MFAAVLVSSNTIGAIPLLVAYTSRAAADPEIINKIASDPNDLSVLNLAPNLGLLIMLFPFLVGLLTFLLLVKPLNNRTTKEVINGTGKIRWNRFLVSFTIWLIFSSIYFFMYLKVDPSNFTLKDTSESLILLVAISIVFIPFQATFEEVLFRGYLMQGFAVLVKNRWFPILITSVFFGLMHAFNPEVKEFGFLTMMPQYILFGIIFGIITILDDGIEAAMGAHTANNAFLCIMVNNKASALQTNAIYEQVNVYPLTEFMGLLLTGIVFVIILKWLFKWGNFTILFSKVESKPSFQSPYTDFLS